VAALSKLDLKLSGSSIVSKDVEAIGSTATANVATSVGTLKRKAAVFNHEATNTAPAASITTLTRSAAIFDQEDCVWRCPKCTSEVVAGQCHGRDCHWEDEYEQGDSIVYKRQKAEAGEDVNADESDSQAEDLRSMDEEDDGEFDDFIDDTSIKSADTGNDDDSNSMSSSRVVSDDSLPEKTDESIEEVDSSSDIEDEGIRLPLR
jgi:hypothetical protein